MVEIIRVGKELGSATFARFLNFAKTSKEI